MPMYFLLITRIYIYMVMLCIAFLKTNIVSNDVPVIEVLIRTIRFI